MTDRRLLYLLLPIAAAPLLCVGGTAQARPRDEVMSGAFRCAAIADSRQWLNCYYGAAQPARTELGLSPAPPAQLALVASPPVGGTPSDLPVRDAVMESAFGCNAPQSPAWLNCYYSAAQPMRAQLGLSPAPQPQSSAARAPLPAIGAQDNPAAPPPMPRRNGFLSGIVGGDKTLVRNMAIAAYQVQSNGAFRVTLADGQVWEQSPENARVHTPRLQGAPANHTVTVEPGILDSYDMKFSRVDGFFKVHRLR